MAKATYHLIFEQAEPFERRLIERLGNCQKATLASAFFTKSALDAIENALLTALEKGAQITFLLGRYDYVTEPQAVKRLIKLSEKFPSGLKILFDSDFGFHYKLAVFRVKKKRVVIIGSSNLTPKGLASDGEVNLEVVNNTSVYQQAMDCLTKRIEIADLAADAIKEYERAYNRAKKFRRQRKRWHSSGAKTWISKRRKFAVSEEPTSDKYTLCWIDGYEQDTKLKTNIRKEQNRARRAGNPIKGTWVHIQPKSETRLYQEGQDFIVVDDKAKCFGFAVCTKIIHVLDSNERREPIVFYRFLRGWKFSDKASYIKRRNELFPRYRPIVSKGVTERLKNFFRKLQKRR